MTWASPSASPANFAGSRRASMQVRMLKRRAGGIASLPLSPKVATWARLAASTSSRILLMRVPPASLAPWRYGQLGGSKGGPSLPLRRPRRLVALEHVAVLRRVGRPVWRDLLLGEDRRHRALGHAGPAVDALVGVDVELVFPLVDAVHRTHVHAPPVFDADTRFGDHVRHGLFLRAARSARSCSTRAHSSGRMLSANSMFSLPSITAMALVSSPAIRASSITAAK